MVLQNNNHPSNDNIGQVFTPDFIAGFMVKNIVKFLSNHYSDKINYKDLNILEPSTGKGIFVSKLIENNFKNITAYEIDISLRPELIKKYPEINFIFENFLSSSEKEEFDLIIGNPPYLGQNYNAEIFKDILINYPSLSRFFVGNMDLFYFFIHLGILKLKPEGFLSFITTNYWISKGKSTGIKHLKPHITQDCYLLQYIDLSNLRIFRDAQGQHNCIFILRKKTKEEKNRKIDHPIEIIQVTKNKDLTLTEEEYNKKIFKSLLNEEENLLFKKYVSALSNNDLNSQDNWYLLFPEEVSIIVRKIEKFCMNSGKIQLLGDLFAIRNGLILIKDEIFILRENEDIFFDKYGIKIKIGPNLIRLNKSEVKRIKKIYKSRTIKPFGYNSKDLEGYLIYLNKNEFKGYDSNRLDKVIETKYPQLFKYFTQYRSELRRILRNANENQKNIYFPRRGTHIKQVGSKELIDLEQYYDYFPKIFFKFISQENQFGFSIGEFYATSDTYFLWPKPFKNYDPYFILAYLNSDIVKFIFTAKNLMVKRSKTKLERGIAIPQVSQQNSKNKLISKIIVEISKWIALNDCSMQSHQNLDIMNEILELQKFQAIDLDKFKSAMESKDKKYFQNFINDLFYLFFDLEKKKIDYLVRKYYNF